MSEGIVIDARWLRTGIGRYTLSILHGLKQHLRDIHITCVAQPQDAPLVAQFCDRVLKCDARIYGVREQLALPWLARNALAFYAPHYNIPVLWKRRLLVTIHDLNHLLDAKYRCTLKSRLYARPLLKTAVRHADVIITPSQYTKDKLTEHLGVNASRISVIPCCVASVFQQRDKQKSRASVAGQLGIGRPYLLFVGNCSPNKNVPLLLESLARLRGQRRDAPLLVMVGNDCRWRSQMQDYARKLNLFDSVAWVGKVSDSLLANLYSGALMTVMPSFEEGFGLPVIESMACGTPVVCSQAASLPEVAGKAAVFFSPFSCAQLTETIGRLMDSTDLQQQLIAAGLTRASHFSQGRFSESQASAIRELTSKTPAVPQSQVVSPRLSATSHDLDR